MIPRGQGSDPCGAGDLAWERGCPRGPFGAVKSVGSCVFHLEKRGQHLSKLRGAPRFSSLDSVPSSVWLVLPSVGNEAF